MNESTGQTHSFDRCSHRFLEEYGAEAVTSFLQQKPGSVTVTTIDTKLTALHVRLTDKLFLATLPPGAGGRVIVHWEFFLSPVERSAAFMHIYAALIGYLQTQKEYRDTTMASVAFYLEKGPEQYAQGYHRLRHFGGTETCHEFTAVRLWETPLEVLLERYPPPFAALGPFCAGDASVNVLDCKKIIMELKEALEPDRWHTIWHLFRLCIQRVVRSREVMKKLHEEFTKEELEQFGMYQLGRTEGQVTLLIALLRRKFGDPPDWVHKKLQEIDTVEAGKRLLLRIEDASSLDEIWG